MCSSRIAAIWILLVPLAATAVAQTEGLGTIRFPTSGAAAAQAPFLRGMAWLHSFEYEAAIEEFQAAQAIDPDFAMAFWGEAMAYHQSLWLNENVPMAREILARLDPTLEGRLRKAKLPEEQGLIRTADVLFGDGDATARRDAYAAAMRRLAEQFPEHDEIVTLYGLALMGTMQRGIQAAPHGPGHDQHNRLLAGSETQAQIAGVLARVLQRNPQHPGALHYFIHNYDDPAHAHLALDAARAYGDVAPEASHALHMPAHIFVQLGMWSEAAAMDERSFAASDAWVKRKGLPPAMRDYHSLSWLIYEYLQLGRFEDALGTLGEIEPSSLEPGQETLRGLLSVMRSQYAVETGDWSFLQGRANYGSSSELFAIGMSAARRGDFGAAELVRQRLEALAGAPNTPEYRPDVAIMHQEVGALMHLGQGNREQAVTWMRNAVAIEDAMPPPVGPPHPIKPAHELFGEMLLELDDPAGARDQFETTLRTYANRTASLLGLARASGATGDRARARELYGQLATIWADADPNVPGLDEVRAAAGMARETSSQEPAGLLAPGRLGLLAGGLVALAAANAVIFRRRLFARRTPTRAPARPASSPVGSRPGKRRR